MNCCKLRTRTVASVEGKRNRAQDSQGRGDFIHGDQGAAADFLHNAGRLSTEKGTLSTNCLSSNGEMGSRSNQMMASGTTGIHRRPKTARPFQPVEISDPPKPAPVITRMLSAGTVRPRQEQAPERMDLDVHEGGAQPPPKE